MKKILSYTILLLAIGCQHAKKADEPDITAYIEIKHVGIEEKPIQPIFISAKHIYIKIDGDYATINGQKSLLTQRENLILSESKWIVLIIDDHTFQMISVFINQYPFFLKKNVDWREMNYAIIAKGAAHNLSYDQTNVFFSQLIKFLQDKNCTMASISTLKSYLPQQ